MSSIPYPVIGIAELYLNIAEILIEENLLANSTGRLAEAKTYMEKVCERAVIPTVNKAWKKTKISYICEWRIGLSQFVSFLGK